MLTPQEVSGKGFPKASFGSGGYNMAAVDEFLDTLTDDYTSLYKENTTLKGKLKVLAEKVEEYRATEDAMRSTLLTAQRMAAKLVQEAQTEKEQILAEAREEATRQIAHLDEETRQAERRLALAQQNLGDFLSRSRELCVQQAEFLKTLPELPLPEEPQAEPEKSDLDDTVTSIEKDIIKEYTAQAEAPAEEPPAEEESPVEEAPAEPEEEPIAEASPVSGDTTVFPSDFKLNLDQLKFGRNYSGDN